MKKSNLEAEFELQLRAFKITGFEQQFRFHPVREWRFDFADPARKIAIEVDGGTYSGGRHVRGKGFNGDCHKINSAICLGWSVLRGDTVMVNNGELVAYLEEILK